MPLPDLVERSRAPAAQDVARRLVPVPLRGFPDSACARALSKVGRDEGMSVPVELRDRCDLRRCRRTMVGVE